MSSTIRHRAETEFAERFEEVLDPDTGQLKEGESAPTYWQDDISEMADSLVPVYTYDIVDQWREDGCQDIDDRGLVEGLTDVTRIISVVLYERYSYELYECARNAGFDL